MANTDKNIVITPNNGSASDPNIVFSGANATTGAQNITLTVTPNNSGTVAFSGSAGQLLAINNDIANTLSTSGTISATGNITANNFVGNLVGNVTGNFSGSLANGNSNVSIPAANGNINISAVGNANIVVVTGTGANIAGTLSVSGNADSANLTTGNISSTGNITTGAGTGGTITGANLVSANFFTGTLTTAAQPNITSVGTLSSLSVSGNITAGNLIGIFANGNSNISIPAANGNVNISAVGNANVLVVTGTGANINGTLNISGNTIGANIQALTFKTSDIAQSPAFWQEATVNASGSGTAYGFLSRGTLAAQANSDQLFGYATGLGTANTGTTGLTGLTFYGVFSDGASWSKTGNGTINNAYGVYASAPTIGTNNYAIFASGEISATGNITGGNLIGTSVTGTLTTAAQPNITSVGTLTSLSVTGNVTANNISIGNVETVGVFTRYSAVTFLDNANAVAGNRVVVTMPAPATVNGMYSGVLKVYAIRQFDNPGGPRSQTTFKLSRVGNISGANATFYVNEAVVDKTSAFAFQWYFDTTTGTPSLVIGQNTNSYNWYVESELNTSTIPTIAIGSNAGSYGTAYYPLYTLATPGTDAGGLTITASNSSNTMVFDSNGQLSLAGNITAGNLIGIFSNGNSNISIPAANGNINISAGGTPNELVITSTGINIAGTLNATGNANVGNLGTAGLITATGNITGNFFIGNGSQLTGVAAGTATTAQTVTTNAQPNITSVGTLTSLSVSGTANLGVVNGTTASFSGNATVNGNLFVNGNLTYLNVETVAVEDPIIQLQTGANGAAPIANSGKDVGTALNYYDTAAKIAFMGWDVSNAEIAFGSNVSITNEVVTFTSLANTRSGNTLTTGVFATTLSATGNANVGNLGTGGLITATGNITGGNLITGGLLSVTGAVTASSYTAANSLLGYFLANAGTTVGKVYENGNIIKLQAELANYGVALAANGIVMLSFDANGYGAIGSSSGTTGYALRIAKQTTGATTAGSILINPTVQTDVTSTALGVRTSLSTAAGASPYTINNLVGYATYGGTIGANTTVTAHIAYYVDASANTGATNYGFYGGLASAASTFNLYMTGTANNYMAGSLGIGSTSLSAINMRVSKSLTGGTTAFNFVSDGTIGSDVTTSAVLNRVVGQTQAATFTLTNLIYNQAVQGTFGLNSVVTTQSGFVADSTLTGATNNYGFRGSIASGANRFNLYMDGTANNYIAGNFGIGTSTPAVALHVKQNGQSINVEGTDHAYVQFYPRGNTTRFGWMGFGSAGTNNFTIRNDDTGRLALESGNSNVSVSANGNVTTTVAGVANVLVVTSTGANIAGTLSATGNITGNFFIGNGSQLTGITTATSLANGTSNVSIPAVNGNINLSSAGNANILVVTGTGTNITGTLSATGNANIGNIGTAGLITATGNIGGGNLNTTGIVSSSRLISTVTTGTAPFTVTSTTQVANLNVATAGTAGTVTTAAQPNITSVGTLTSLSVSGNITGGNLIGIFANGNSSISIPAANGNINISAAGSPNEIVITSTGINVAGTLNATGNANVGNLGTTTAVITTGNITTINSGLLQNGNSNVSITANANVAIAVTGANRLVVTSTGANLTGTLNISGNTTFSGTGQRIFGDFSNVTLASRTAFQTSATNSDTGIWALPNGTATSSGWVAFNNSNPTNAAYIAIDVLAGGTRLVSSRTGSGSSLPLTFAVGDTGAEAARFDTNRNFLIGSSSANVAYDSVSWKWIGYQVISRNTTAETNQIVFYNPNGQVGFINTNGSVTTYGSVSDYRLKENAQPMTGALAKILSLNPVTYTWKSDGSSGQGFIAHELQAVIPDAVSGTKDAVDEEGNPRYQGVDTSLVVATLVASVKELTALVTQLQAEVNNLKNS